MNIINRTFISQALEILMQMH